ncbi:MAG: DUF262 domain-containing protein [Pseudohongiella sp.]|nr:DUF262 domain-containing protein [Pseudohongiella sp.]
MKESGIELRPISSLLTDDVGNPARYWIPAYQRGYRWTKLQVTHLLDDIWDFIQTSEGGRREAFYCLQPLVIKQRVDGRIEVIDGQQRLTTIYILLTYLKTLVDVLEKKRFEITFETRGEANEPFLAAIDLTRAEENVDFFHICKAYEAVGDWFSGRDGSQKLKLLQHLLNDDEAGRNVKVIWFELVEQDDPVAAFTRLNVGKIPLTNDELIRALFLRLAAAESIGQGLALRIAHEWDQIEKTLQHDAFWYFLSNDQAPSQNRIGLLFKLAAGDDLTELLKRDAYGVFHVFSERLKSGAAEREWLVVKQTFMALEEWYEDRELFHVVGFLIQQGVSIPQLLKSAANYRKSDFTFELRRRAFDLTIGGDLSGLDHATLKDSVRERCENLSYIRDRMAIRKLLLLFNLATLLENPRSNLRFQFDNFKREDWDIEHVRSIAVRRPGRHNERVEWLGHSLGYLRSQENAQTIVGEIEKFILLTQAQAGDYVFEPLYDRVLSYFHESDEGEEHGLANLTLLDRGTNRSYKNAVFAVKRKRLLGLDQSGVFVPLCTRNVFLKCYSPQVDNAMFWSELDATAYGDVIVATIIKFFSVTPEGDL